MISELELEHLILKVHTFLSYFFGGPVLIQTCIRCQKKSPAAKESIESKMGEKLTCFTTKQEHNRIENNQKNKRR